MKKKEYWYLIQDLIYPGGADLTTTEMVNYAKKQLKINKSVHGLDKEITLKDLSLPINAWVYLENIGIGLETNRKSWEG